MSDGAEQPQGWVEIVVGYLVTHADGYEVRLDKDRTRADLYAARNHATIEPMYVKRPLPAGRGVASIPVPAAERGGYLGMHGAPDALEAGAHPWLAVTVCAPDAHVARVWAQFDVDGTAVDLQQ